MEFKRVEGVRVRGRGGPDNCGAEMIYTITLELDTEDFEREVGRPPPDREEFEKWGWLCEKGLLKGYIDWKRVFESARNVLLNPNRYPPARRII